MISIICGSNVPIFELEKGSPTFWQIESQKKCVPPETSWKSDIGNIKPDGIFASRYCKPYKLGDCWKKVKKNMDEVLRIGHRPVTET